MDRTQDKVHNKTSNMKHFGVEKSGRRICAWKGLI